MNYTSSYKGEFNLPALSESGLSRYMSEIQKFPMLEKEEEYMLAKALQRHGDLKSAHKLVTSHLRLVVKIANQFRGYNLALIDLISEGNIGLMQAVKKFNPDQGVRLATYAMWWIKAAIQEFVLKSWSLVKIGTTAVQKKLFFNLRRLKHRIDAFHEGDLRPEEVTHIAKELDVPEKDVIEMDRRIGGDSSLNQHLGYDSEGEWVDLLPAPEESHEIKLLEADETMKKKTMLESALSKLNDREQDIINQRHLTEPPATLDDLSKIYSVSRERIRQIEARAMEKLQMELC